MGPSQLDTDDSLVGRAQGGDRGAFEELVRRSSRLLYARLYLETGDAHLAEDLVQETLLRAFHALGTLHEPGTWRGWLLKIAQNVLTDAVRRQGRHKRSAPPREANEALANVAGSVLSPAEEAARTEERAKVLAVLRSLPEEYRGPLTLRYLAGADYAEIELQLGLSNGALRGLLHRGLKLLRSRLGEPEPD